MLIIKYIAGIIISPAILTFSPRDLRFQGPLSSPVGKEHLPYQTPDRNNHIDTHYTITVLHIDK